MARKNNFIVGLDLGSVKTCALVCNPNAEGKLELAGLGIAESKGWRKGMIVNLDLTALAVRGLPSTRETSPKKSPCRKDVMSQKFSALSFLTIFSSPSPIMYIESPHAPSRQM